MKKWKILLVITCVLTIASCALGIYSVVDISVHDADYIFSKSFHSIVEVKASDETVGESFGSGEIMDDGLIITNAHVVTYSTLGVIQTFKEYFVRFADETDYRAVTLVKYDSELDLAVLKIKNAPQNSTPIKKGNSDKLKYGEKVYAIGNASNYGLSITQGIISMPKVNIEYDGKTRMSIQCDLTISAGNSGGALLDGNGRLIGITTFRTKDHAGNVIYGLAYSIPINTVLEYMR